MNTGKAGQWLFLISVIIAILAGLAAPWAVAAQLAWVAVLLVVLGVITYVLNAYEKDSIKVLVAFIALTFVYTTIWAPLDAVLSPLGTIIGAIVGYVLVFLAPIAVISAVKAVEGISSKK
jgi:small-conductance mechanosensitive channel